MAQISFSFSGGFWPISFPLFHGTARSLALETVLVSAYMNGSFVVERSPILNVDQGRLSTHTGRSTLAKQTPNHQVDWSLRQVHVVYLPYRLHSKSHHICT